MTQKDATANTPQTTNTDVQAQKSDTKEQKGAAATTKEQLKTTYTIQDLKASGKIRKAITIRATIVDILERMHNDTITLDSFDFTKEIENLIIEKAKRHGILDLEFNLTEQEKIIKAKADIEGSIEILSSQLNNYIETVKLPIMELQRSINQVDPNYSKKLASAV